MTTAVIQIDQAALGAIFQILDVPGTSSADVRPRDGLS